jgi:hypothetical protein
MLLLLVQDVAIGGLDPLRHRGALQRPLDEVRRHHLPGELKGGEPLDGGLKVAHRVEERDLLRWRAIVEGFHPGCLDALREEPGVAELLMACLGQELLDPELGGGLQPAPEDLASPDLVVETALHDQEPLRVRRQWDVAVGGQLPVQLGAKRPNDLDLLVNELSWVLRSDRPHRIDSPDGCDAAYDSWQVVP